MYICRRFYYLANYNKTDMSEDRFKNKYCIPFAWQPRFHDRIVRDTNELNQIATYIENNIAQWAFDELNGMKNAV